MRRQTARPAAKRSYTMGARADATAATRQAIFDAAYQRFVRQPFEEVTLQQIGDDAGVTVQTVLRHFGSKEELLVAGAEHWSSGEWERRAVPPGDVASAARVLGERYEQIASATRQMHALAVSVRAVGQQLEAAQRNHHEWLARVFAPWLPERGAVRARRLAQLFAATEIMSWMAWRTVLGLSKTEATRCLGEHLQTLVDAWTRADRGGRKR